MNIVANIVLTGTSIAPVLLAYALLALYEGEYLPAVILMVFSFLLFGLSVVLLLFVKRHLELLTISLSSIEVADREAVGLLVLYLLPLLRTSFSEIEFPILIPAAVIFLALAVTGYNYHFNPLLIASGWHFYKVGTPEGVTYVLITRKSLRSVVGSITVGQLTGYTVIDLE